MDEERVIILPEAFVIAKRYANDEADAHDCAIAITRAIQAAEARCVRRRKPTKGAA